MSRASVNGLQSGNVVLVLLVQIAGRRRFLGDLFDDGHRASRAVKHDVRILLDGVFGSMKHKSHVADGPSKSVSLGGRRLVTPSWTSRVSMKPSCGNGWSSKGEKFSMICPHQPQPVAQ